MYTSVAINTSYMGHTTSLLDLVWSNPERSSAKLVIFSPHRLTLHARRNRIPASTYHVCSVAMHAVFPLTQVHTHFVVDVSFLFSVLIYWRRPAVTITAFSRSRTVLYIVYRCSVIRNLLWYCISTVHIWLWHSCLKNPLFYSSASFQVSSAIWSEIREVMRICRRFLADRLYSYFSGRRVVSSCLFLLLCVLAAWNVSYYSNHRTRVEERGDAWTASDTTVSL